jgi:aspartyl aminopeptidase
MLSAKLGLRTIGKFYTYLSDTIGSNKHSPDIGNPQWSMHSIRETGGTDDVKHGIDLLRVNEMYTVLVLFTNGIT